jgi:hypothetical protein
MGRGSVDAEKKREEKQTNKPPVLFTETLREEEAKL